MALNVTEATAVNDLTDWLMDRPRWSGDMVTDDEARLALQILVKGASKRLMAGWTEEQVQIAWKDRRRR